MAAIPTLASIPTALPAPTPQTSEKTHKESFATPVADWEPLETSETQESVPASTAQRPRPWRTTLIRFGPLSGIFCMCLAIASIAASLGILVESNGATVASWTAPPSTYLAVCTAVANLAMRYACIQGVVIAWWYRALHGSTLAKLHWDWRSGTTLRGALTAGSHMGLLGLACIFSTIVVMDGVSLPSDLAA